MKMAIPQGDDMVPRPIPATHNDRHENGGADEINVAGLSGALADDQSPAVHGANKHTNVTREIFLSPFGYSSERAVFRLLADYGCAYLTDATSQIVAVTGKIPDDFVSLVEVDLVILAAAANGNMYHKIDWTFAANGESYTTHSGDTGWITSALVGGNLTEIAIAGALAGVAVGDYFGIAVNRDATNALDTINNDVIVIGFLVKYVAEQ